MELENSAFGTKKLPYSDDTWKIPGYTGHVVGLNEVFAKTPITAQIECHEPEKESFIFTRTRVPPRSMPERDPCNTADFKKAQPDNVWARQQTDAVQPSCRPPRSNIANGDLRINGFVTSYSTTYASPFERTKKLRSPMRNSDLAQAADLRPLYQSSFNRVTEKRLMKMIQSISERLAAKLGNNNDNAFRTRKLFKMYDEDNTGLIHLEDFRMMMETVGIQLDDDSLLALYHVYDKDCTGYLRYAELMKVLLDADYYALYEGNNDTTQATADLNTVKSMVSTIKNKFSSSVEELRRVLSCLDDGNTGYLSTKDFLAGCAAMGVTLNDAEEAYVRNLVEANEHGEIKWEGFVNLF